MAKHAYEKWIAGLPGDQRDFVQTLMAVLMAMLDERFNVLAADIQRVERRQHGHVGRTGELERRLDLYEEQQWNAAKEAIEQFARSQFTADQYDALIQALYKLAADVESLKRSKQANE